jgi:hypothetical protein
LLKDQGALGFGKSPLAASTTAATATTNVIGGASGGAGQIPNEARTPLK